MENMLVLLVLVVTCLSTTSALYDASDDVIKLTDTSFNQVIEGDHPLWFIQFYQPGNEQCKKFAPKWKAVATVLKGLIKIGAVNAENDKQLVEKYKIMDFPAIKIFRLDKSNPTDYTGGHSMMGVMHAMQDEADAIVQDRMTALKYTENEFFHEAL